MDWKELIGFVGGFQRRWEWSRRYGGFSSSKSAHEISLIFTLFFNIGIAFWLVYGILQGLLSVIIWNGMALALGGGMFYAKMKWGRQVVK